MIDKEKETFRANATVEFEKLIQDFNKIENIPKPSLGNLIILPQLYFIKVDKNNLQPGCIKDTHFKPEDIETKIIKIPIGYAAFSRSLEDVKCLIPVFISAIKTMELKHKFSSNEYHYGDFCKLKDVVVLEDSACVNIVFEGRVAPFDNRRKS